MSAVMETMGHNGLAAEWWRIELLGRSLLEARAGHEPPQPLFDQLTRAQHEVERLRQDGGAWEVLPVQGLPPVALDLLAAAYAPRLNPDVALIYQDLQPDQQPEPDLSLLHRLLAFDTDEYLMAQRLADLRGELVHRRLIRVRGQGPRLKLYPHPDVVAVLTGLPTERSRIPGAVRVPQAASWNDLVASPAQQRQLKEYLMWIHHAEQVTEGWGGRAIAGPVALFSGPSGTGKTFAACVLATELGWELYRIDLGALVSKYIGETEKNLNTLFDEVQGRQILLQFDEVDALMGRRGEIREARDRYANMEVSHLLSRIEEHHGPCILTTNLRSQIDPAFQRRFHFVIGFPRPEARDRLALWQRLLPPGAPRAPGLDLKEVAEAVPLTGGEIRNAAHHAAILAADEGQPIDMPQIAAGVWRVLQKGDGRARLSQLRQLARYLPSEIAPETLAECPS